MIHGGVQQRGDPRLETESMPVSVGGFGGRGRVARRRPSSTQSRILPNGRTIGQFADIVRRYGLSCCRAGGAAAFHQHLLRQLAGHDHLRSQHWRSGEQSRRRLVGVAGWQRL